MMISRVADVSVFSKRAQELNKKLENKIEKSVYFMQYKDENNLLEEQAFYEFLNKITAFIWA